MAKIFVDTGALIALTDEKDDFHNSALGFWKQKEEFATSVWVVEEFIAYLHSRLGLRAAIKGVEFLQELGEWMETKFLDDNILKETFNQFQKYGSRRISIVDVSNAVLMKDLGLEQIFAFDKRFRSVFKLQVLPESSN